MHSISSNERLLGLVRLLFSASVWGFPEDRPMTSSLLHASGVH